MCEKTECDWRRGGGERGQAQQPVFEVSSSYLPSSLSQLSKMSTLFTMGEEGGGKLNNLCLNSRFSLIGQLLPIVQNVNTFLNG